MHEINFKIHIHHRHTLGLLQYFRIYSTFRDGLFEPDVDIRNRLYVTGYYKGHPFCRTFRKLILTMYQNYKINLSL